MEKGNECPNCGKDDAFVDGYCHHCCFDAEKHRKDELFDELLNYVVEVVSGNDLEDTLHNIGFTDSEIAKYVG